MENQHRLITGYRELTASEIDLMNAIKAHAEATRALITKIEEHVKAQFDATDVAYPEPKSSAEIVFGTDPIDTPEQIKAKEIERTRLTEAQPFRWIGVAKNDIQIGLMSLTRAIAQPTTF